MFGFPGDGGGRSPMDRYVEQLRRVRDEGFTRTWTAQLPHEPDLLTTMAVAVREVERIEEMHAAGVDEFAGATFGSTEQRARSRALRALARGLPSHDGTRGAR